MNVDKEYADSLKKGIKELVDGLRVDNEQDLEVLKLVYGQMDDNGFITAMPDKPPELPAKSQRKNEIISMIGGISNGRYIDMIYGFVRRLYMEERGNEKKKQE